MLRIKREASVLCLLIVLSASCHKEVVAFVQSEKHTFVSAQHSEYQHLAPACHASIGAAQKNVCGWNNITQAGCIELGCCWQNNQQLQEDDSLQHKANIQKSRCLQPASLGPGYSITNATLYTNGIIVHLSSYMNARDEFTKESSPTYEPFGSSAPQLRLSIAYETHTRLRVRIDDPLSKRWEIPQDIIERPNIEDVLMQGDKDTISFADKSSLQFHVHEEKDSSGAKRFLGFSIEKKSSQYNRKQVIFDSTVGPLFFGSQLLALSSRLPKNHFLVGLGETTRSNGLRIPVNSTQTLWARDCAAAFPNVNLYGSHPFYIDVRKEDGSASGVLLLNSNAMDIAVDEGQLTWLVTGGVLDFYIFSGPSANDVVSQYVQFVGMPYFPPKWTFGWHQSRYGYRSVVELREVVENYRAADIPLDVIWSDIDYMDAWRDFTVDPILYPIPQLQQFVASLHSRGQRYVTILDPGILHAADTAEYEPARRLLDAGAIIAEYDSKSYYLGQVWPGPVYFPDFLHPNAQSWWTSEIARLRARVPVDGVWCV